MKKLRFVLALFLVCFSGTAAAEMAAGVGYASLSEDDIRLGAIYGSLGYRMEMSDSFYLVPEFRVGMGIGDDTYLGVDVEIDGMFGVSLRAQWEGESGYFYVNPSYMNLEVKASAAGVAASSDDWEFGAGIGAGYRFSDSMAIEAGWEYFDGTDVLGIGLRFKF